MTADQLGLWVGFVLTLMIFSYVLGDNLLYRIAVYVFVGLAAGYTTVIAVDSVIAPWLAATVLSGDPGAVLLGLIPLLFGVLLLFRTTGRFSRLGGIALAFLIGVGTAVALVGVVSGTLLPITGSVVSGLQSDLINGFLILLGVVSTLIYFQYLARRGSGGRVERPLLLRAIGAVGQGVVTVTLGALYGGAILTSLAILSERIVFILSRLTGG